MVIGDENLVQIVRIIIIIIIVSTEINERRWSFFLVENLENWSLREVEVWVLISVYK